MTLPDRLTIGQVSERSGVATSALRYYEDAGLISSERADSGHRRYRRDVLRRVAFIKVAQLVGLSLEEIREALSSLPAARTPTTRDWERLSKTWTPRLDARIAMLERLRDRLDGCIGCGCLSMAHCGLLNPGDAAAGAGPGPRYVLDGDDKPT
jgi:MerR family redox-sensitive transcriptional activator SoxR